MGAGRGRWGGCNTRIHNPSILYDLRYDLRYDLPGGRALHLGGPRWRGGIKTAWLGLQLKLVL